MVHLSGSNIQACKNKYKKRKVQSMKTKMSKTKDESETSGTTIRVRKSTKSALLAKLKEINQKQLGRKLKADELLTLALNGLTDEDVKALQEMSLSNEDRKKRMRQKYIEVHGPISEDDFTGFTFSPEFQTFLKEHFNHGLRDTLPTKSVAQAS
jgi:hypothetical protein